MGAVIASPRLNCPTASGLPKRASSTRIPHCVPAYTTLPVRVQLKLSRRDLVGFDEGHSRYLSSKTGLEDIWLLSVGRSSLTKRDAQFACAALPPAGPRRISALLQHTVGIARRIRANHSGRRVALCSMLLSHLFATGRTLRHIKGAQSRRAISL